MQPLAPAVCTATEHTCRPSKGRHSDSSVAFLLVARFAALAALIVVAVVAALAVVDSRSQGAGPTGESRPSTAAPIRPPLRPVATLASPGYTQVDSGAGLYPALTTTRGLAFPAPQAVRRAARFLGSRDGETAFAVADERGGVSGVATTKPFSSASLTKAMILVAFLRRLAAEGGEATESEILSLGYMIRLSDNASADSIYARVGDERLRELARRAGMRDFAISGDWANAKLTAADQARFFLTLDRLVPRRFRGLARGLLETVSELQSWGIPAGARPQWRVFFKGGWRPDSDGEVVHQAALLERGSGRVAIAVLTRGNPYMVYGEKTVQGVTERLLAGGDSPRTTTSK